MTENLKDRISAGDALAARVRAGKGKNWLLIPGGPGMGCEYLADLFGQIDIGGSVWKFDLNNPRMGSRSEVEVADGWRHSLLDIAARLSPCLVVGHSFGGMLALSAAGLESHLEAIVLMDSSPDRGWETAVERAAKILRKPNEPAFEKAFEANPSAQTLKRLYVALAHYYFTPEFEAAGKDLLLRNSYQHEVHKIGQLGFFPRYEARLDLSSVPTYCLAGAQDVVTPLSLFSQSATWQGTGVQYHEITRGGHFPWIENFGQVSAILRRIDNEI